MVKCMTEKRVVKIQLLILLTWVARPYTDISPSMRPAARDRRRRIEQRRMRLEQEMKSMALLLVIHPMVIHLAIRPMAIHLHPDGLHILHLHMKMIIQSLLLLIHLLAIPLLQVGQKILNLDGHHILHMKMNLLDGRHILHMKMIIHILDGPNLLLVILTLLQGGLRTLHMRTKRTRIRTMSTTTTTTDTLHTTTTPLLPTLPSPTILHQRNVPKSATSLPTQTAPASTQPPSLKMEEETVMWEPSNLTYRYGATWTQTLVTPKKLAQMRRKAVRRKDIIGPDLPALLNRLL